MIDQDVEAGPLARALEAAGLAYTQPNRAVRTAQLALDEAGGDRQAASVATRALGMAAAALGDLTGAARLLRRAAQLAERAGLPERAGEALGYRAYVLLLTGRVEEALAELDRADDRLPDGVSAARVRMQRGLILSEIRRFGEAVDSLDIALATLIRAGGDELLEADVLNNRGIARIGQRDWRAAAVDLERAETLYTRCGHAGRTALVRHNWAIAEALRGDLPAALAAFDEAADRYRAAEMPSGLLAVDRAETLLGVGLAGEAMQVARRAVEEFDRQRNAVDAVQARLLLAEAALAGGDPATALREARRARRAADGQGRSSWAALARHLELRSRWRAGDRGRAAVRFGQDAVRELDRAGWPGQAMDARLVLARLLLHGAATGDDRHRDALRELRIAAAGRRRGPAVPRARGWHAEAIRRQAEGDPVGAARAVRAGLGVLEDFQAGIGASDMRANAAAHGSELARLGLDLAIGGGRGEQILGAAERGRAGALRFRPVRPPDDATLAAELAELRQVATRLQSAAEPAAALLARQRELEGSVRSRARHAAGPGHRPGEVGAVPATVLRGAVGDGALVEFVALDGQLAAVVVTAGRCSFRRLGPIAPVEQGLHRLRSALEMLANGTGSARSLAAVGEVVAGSAAALDAMLLQPLVQPLLAPKLGSAAPAAGAAALVIVPTGALHRVPWSALPTCAVRPTTVAPSAALWHRATTRAAHPSAPTVLAHGPGLPNAAAEVRALGRRYPDAVRLTGRAAGVGAVLAALDGADTAHLAVHGRFRADNPMLSELLLADGALTVYDLERLAVAPRQVLLAACDSGVTRVHRGDELLGLAATLLAMGTSSLVAAMIPVPDAASRRLMTAVHRHLRGGAPAGRALAAARRDTLVAAGRRDPVERAGAVAAAAGFQCFGAG